MNSSQIDFSAQFGGRDAAMVVLPHFKALKAASRDLRLKGFPFPKLAYILRVDGEVNQYGLSGAGNLVIDSDREYLSVDIGIKHGDRGQVAKVICAAIISSVEQIKALRNANPWKVDWNSLETCLSALIASYESELRANS